MPGPSVFPSGEPGVSGDFWGSQEGCQGSLPQTSMATTTAVVVEVAAAVAVPLAVGPLVEGARARGGQRLPGAPAAPGAAGGSGCWACCSPGYCSWGCSLASSLWVRVAAPCCLFIGNFPGCL